LRLETTPPDPKFDSMQEETVQPEESQEPKREDKSPEERLAEAESKLAAEREKMLRALAEAENVRKRAQAEAATSRRYALEDFAAQLLPVADSLEAALANEQATREALRDGVQLTLKQLRAALEKASIREINPAVGERFDPHRHHAMAAVEAQSEPNTIVAVMQKGYSLHDRVLRPALVAVSKALESSPGNPISDTDLD
jgi:molecular chaperone GrpE